MRCGAGRVVVSGSGEAPRLRVKNLNLSPSPPQNTVRIPPSATAYNWIILHPATDFIEKILNCHSNGLECGSVERMPDITISDIHSLNQKEAFEILAQIARVEKKTFPSNETFSFGQELWRKKPNTRVLYATSAPAPGARPVLIAYAVYVRQKGAALLHKVCVIEALRRQGVGQTLMEYMQQRLQKEGCQYIQLWVDKAREPARALYTRTGFRAREEIADYYAPGRTGIRMVLDLECDV